MADNSYTRQFQDGTALTQAQLDTAFKSVKPSITNTTALTAGSTSGHFLKSQGDGLEAVFAAVPDPLGPFALRNYGLSASASAGALTVALKTNAGTDATSTDKVNLTFSNNGTTSATYTSVDVSGALSLAITASATLGFTGTSANRVYVYAINNAGTARIAVSAKSDFDRGVAVSTTAMSASADSAQVLYASAALTVVPRLLGWVTAAMNSSKQWQTPTKVAVANGSPSSGSFVVSDSSGTYTTTSSSFVDVTNLSVSITTNGRPVVVTLISDGTGSDSYLGQQTTGSTSTTSRIQFLRDGNAIAYFTTLSIAGGATANTIGDSPSSFSHIEMPPAGTYTYKVQVRNTSGTSMVVSKVKLVAYEI